MFAAVLVAGVVLAASENNASENNVTATPNPCDSAQHNFQHSRMGAADSDQRFAARVDSTSGYAGHGHVMCESAVVDGTVIQTETEFFSNDVGMQLGIGVTPNWKHGLQLGTALYIKKVNGAAPGTATLSIPESYQQYVGCGGFTGGDEDFAQFDDAMALMLETESGAKFTAYGFRTDAVKDSILAGEKLFSIGSSLQGCKLEVVAELPIPAQSSTELTFEVEVTIKGPDEDVLRETIDFEETSNEIILTMTDGGNVSEIMRMATGLVCKNNPDFSITNVTWTSDGKRQFTCSVPRANIATCGSVFWDPTVSPACKEGKICRTKAGESSSQASFAPKQSLFVTIVAAFLAVLLAC